MKTHGRQLDTEYVTCRQRLPQGVTEFRWTSGSGEILGHRHERLIADLRAALHNQTARPEPVRAPSVWKVPRLGRLTAQRQRMV